MTSDHFDGRRFFNPGGANGQPGWRVPRMLLTRRTRWPASVPVVQSKAVTAGPDELIVTFIGHATFLVQAGAVNVLIDPVFSLRASPVSFAGPKRVRPPGMKLEDLPPISLLLLSHNHYDHCDITSLREIARRFDPPVVTPIGNASLLRSAGFMKVTELDWWDQASEAGMRVTATPAQHFSARSMFDRNRALWAGFFIEGLHRRVYFAGDSGYGPHFTDIARQLGPIDLALLPIGAYEPRWFMKDIHLNPAEAVQAHLDLGARASIAMHYGTFQLTPEGIDEPVRALQKALGDRGVPAENFRTLDAGQSIVVPRGASSQPATPRRQ